MDFIKNIFRSKPTVEDTSEMLDEDLYWQLIASSLQNSSDEESQEAYLIKEIEALSPKEIIGFRLRTDKLLYDTYNSEMWCAAYIMNGGCSDDSFEYFRCWVISRGKEVYYNAKNNPDTLINAIQPNAEFYDFENFWYVALQAFENKTGKELYDFIGEDFQYGEGNYPQIDFTWKEEDDDSLKAICPKLFAKFEE